MYLLEWTYTAWVLFIHKACIFHELLKHLQFIYKTFLVSAYWSVYLESVNFIHISRKLSRDIIEKQMYWNVQNDVTSFWFDCDITCKQVNSNGISFLLVINFNILTEYVCQVWRDYRSNLNWALFKNEP